jgi:hypothetical protein
MEKSDTAKVIGKFSKSLFPLISIVLFNSLLMFIALKTGLSINELIWLYWCEGIIIGILQSIKVFATEATTISFLRFLAPNTPSMCLTIFFSALQVPFHCFFAFWIYRLDPTFDYVHGLLVMGGVIVAYELFNYMRNSRPWSEPDDLRNVIIESGIYLVRFIPVLGLYHFMVKTQAGEGNMTLLTVEFMLFKFASDVISHIVERSLLKGRKP